MADNYGFSTLTIKSGGFNHAVFLNGIQVDQSSVLNVYLEGDGVPWRYRYVVSQDPTSSRTLMLRLMDSDISAAAYVGRPCYIGFADMAPCEPALWTFARYSETVVSAMSGVLDQIKEKTGSSQIRLFGHSGGGALALLIAAQRNDVERVVTLAGNLDTQGWTDLHRYSPLSKSLNPVNTLEPDSVLRQIHLLGGKDRNIPPELVLDWVKAQENSGYYVFEEFDHACCWSRRLADCATRCIITIGNPANHREGFAGFGNLASVFGKP